MNHDNVLQSCILESHSYNHISKFILALQTLNNFICHSSQLRDPSQDYPFSFALSNSNSCFSFDVFVVAFLLKALIDFLNSYEHIENTAPQVHIPLVGLNDTRGNLNCLHKLQKGCKNGNKTLMFEITVSILL
jgi:hypothetical protein